MALIDKGFVSLHFLALIYTWRRLTHDTPYQKLRDVADLAKSFKKTCCYLITALRCSNIDQGPTNKENEYRFWRLAIPTIKNQQKVNFLFMSIITKFLLGRIMCQSTPSVDQRQKM